MIHFKGLINETKLPASQEYFFICHGCFVIFKREAHKPSNNDVSMDLTSTWKAGGERQRGKKTSVYVSDCFI